MATAAQHLVDEKPVDIANEKDDMEVILSQPGW
jgi:hypothetical protein